MHEETYQRLEEMRNRFSNIFNYALSQDNCPDKVLDACLVYERESVASFRKEVLRDYIIEKGLEAHMAKIISGINNSCSVVNLTKELGNSKQMIIVVDFRDLLQNEQTAFLNYSLEYVDRWEMYNNLFGKKE